MAPSLSDWWSDRGFLRVVDRFEQVIAKLLGLLLLLLIILSSLELIRQLALALVLRQSVWQGDALFAFFGELLNILIGLELLQNITAYLKRHAVQIQLVLLTAITAVARKLIVLPGTGESKPLMVVALGFCVLTLAAAYWLMRHVNLKSSLARTTPARSFQEGDPWPPPGADDRP
jgi:LPXTG-motif cell wall-anchored protein